MLDTVTEAQWREFDANGVVSLGVALSPTELRALSFSLVAPSAEGRSSIRSNAARGSTLVLGLSLSASC